MDRSWRFLASPGRPSRSRQATVASQLDRLAAGEVGGRVVEQRPDLAARGEEGKAAEQGQLAHVHRPAQPADRAREGARDVNRGRAADVRDGEDEQAVLEEHVQDHVGPAGGGGPRISPAAQPSR